MNETLSTSTARAHGTRARLTVEPSRLAYIEELLTPDTRHVKFWFVARWMGGELSTSSPEAQDEHITEAAWLGRLELSRRTVFPPVLTGRYWQDRDAAFAVPVHLGLRRMEFW